MPLLTGGAVTGQTGQTGTTHPLGPAGRDVIEVLLVVLAGAEGVGLSHSGRGHHLSNHRGGGGGSVLLLKPNTTHEAQSGSQSSRSVLQPAASGPVTSGNTQGGLFHKEPRHLELTVATETRLHQSLLE